MMMQCGTSGELVAPRRVEKETIHSGHFMVSHFEAEAQVDEDELIVPGLDDDDDKAKVLEVSGSQTTQVTDINELNSTNKKISHHQQLSIETNLTKLFQCMSLAYRQKLTSPKWNRFKGVRLRWKDKIRLNNLIWRCWHMQFIMKQNTLVCQFASPLDVDTHNKPEAVVLEGKYWKRRLAAVTAEYKKWRLFHRNRVLGCINKDASEVLSDMDILDWQSQNNDSMHMLVDEDYMTLMTDTLFSTISANQPYAFPDSREIARAGLADFIQPSLGPLQPNLEDFMDTLEPLQELISGSKLPSVPEENVIDDSYRSLNQNYTELNLLPTVSSTTNISDLQATEMHSDYGTSSNNQLVENFVNLYNTDTQTNTLINRNNRILNRYDNGNRRELQAQLSQESTVPDLHELPSQTQQLFNSNQFQNFQIIDVTSSVPSNQTFKVPTSPSSTSSTHQSFKISNPRSINFQPAQNVNTISNNQISRHFKIPTMPDTKQSWSTPSASVQQFTNQSPTKISSDSEIQVKDPLRANLGFVISGTKYGTKQRATRVRSSSLEPRQNRPPLKSSVSDPALLSNANSLLLAQLLSNNSQNMYNTSTVSRTVSEKLNTSGVLAHSSHSNPSSTGSMQILSVPNQSNLTTTLLITPVGIASHSNSTNVPQNQMVVSSLSSSSSHTKTPSPQSSMSVESPTSPLSPSNSPGAHTDIPHREQRRVGHIHAEQKRRYNIKNGFEMLHSLIPQLNQNPNVKLSKAAMLQKGAEYIRQLRNERTQLSEEIESLRQQIECLNSSISNCQSLLPATGAPVSRQRANKMKEMFDEYVRTRTLMNWKFWVFSVLFEPLLISYNNAVSTSSMDDLYRSTLLWVEQHCSLVDLRPAVLNSLRLLSTKTEILSDPDRLPEEARQAVMETAAHQGQH